MGQIYQIFNTINNKSYIGQTIKSTDKRWKYGHVADSRRGSLYPLHCAIRKYSHKQFNVIILEECDDELLNSRETFWIAELKTIVPNGYNLREGGSFGKHSEISKQKNRTAHLGKMHNVFSRKNMSDAQKGKKKQKRSIEHCKKLSDAHKGKTFSKEHRIKISLGLKGKTRGKNYQLNINKKCHWQKAINFEK